MAVALAGALAALVPSIVMWGFTVDDALIPLRYAHHLAIGAGYCFDIGGLSTDGVTPLPWAFLLAPFAESPDLVIGLARVKLFGIVALTVSGFALGRRMGRLVEARRSLLAAIVALGCLALAFQVGAWAASGMETGVATALATFAVVSFDRPVRAAALAGLVAALRPELVVWAMIVAAGAEVGHSRELGADLRAPRAVRAVLASAVVAIAPFAICALVRTAIFGRPAPLAVLAKPSDLSHGLVYGSAATVVVLTPLLALAPLALQRGSVFAKTVALGAVAHFVVVIAVGGDWMPYARLMVPIAPSLALVFVDLVAGRAIGAVSAMARSVVAIVIGGFVASSAASAGRHVQADRAALIERARPWLGSARAIAALDIGWVGAASDATIIDLAGLTDPSIAALPGGHTSKNVDMAMLLERGVDTIVVYSELRRVEQRLVYSPLFAERFERVAEIALGSRGSSYAIYQRR